MAFPFFSRQEPVIGSDADDAFHLGRYWTERTGAIGPKMQMPGTEPIVVVGRNRSGKDVGIGTYNALRLNGRSTVWVDPRFECGAIAGPYRRTLGPAYNVNPFGLLTHLPRYRDLQSDGLNLPRLLDPTSAFFFDEATWIASAYIKVRGKDSHFDERARQLFTGALMIEVEDAAAQGRMPLLANVRAMLTEADEFDPKTGEIIKGLTVTARRAVKRGHPQIADQLGSFTVDNEEIRGVRATVEAQTQTLVSQPLRDDERRGRVPLERLGTEAMTVFLSMPPDCLTESSIHSNTLRAWVAAAIRQLYRPSKVACTFWLNEFAAFGKFEAVEAAFGLVAGAGIQICLVVQSLVQLRQNYGLGWENFIGNAGAVVLIGPPADKFTADYLAARSGERTIYAPNVGQQLNAAGGVGLSNGEAYTRRQHLMPQDLYDLQPGYGYVWVAGLSNPIPAYFPPYFDVAQLANRARANPWYRG